MLHSKINKETNNVITLQASRFKFLLGQIRDFNGLDNGDYLNHLCKEYDSVTFDSIEIGDSNKNIYTLIMDGKLKDKKGRCTECDCQGNRVLNAKTGVCFYKETMSNETKLK